MINSLIWMFLHFAGPITLIMLLCLGYLLWQSFRQELRENKKEWTLSLAWGLGLSVLTFTSTGVFFKVLSDETNLLSVANMLIQFGQASNTEQWVNYYHTYKALDVSVPTRPILFPLLTALVHGMNGMREWSPFAVNFILLVSFFTLSLQWAVRRSMARWQLAVPLAMCSVLLINATSGGYDLCSLFFLALMLALFHRFWREPRDDRMWVLWFATLCFASVRYESAVILAPMGLLLWWKQRRFPLLPGLVGLFFVSPLVLQRVITWGAFENPPGVPAFSLSHLWNHLPVFLNAFFVDPEGPYPIVIHWLGIGGLVLAFRRREPSFFLAAGYGLFLLCLLLSHHFGLAHHPTQARLFMPLSVALVFLGVWFLREIHSWVDLRGLALVWAVMFFHHHRYTVSDPLMSQLTMTREMRHIQDFRGVAKIPGTLFVYDRPGQLAALGESSISVNEFYLKKEMYLAHLRNRLYSRIILVERVDRTKPPEVYSLVREGFRLMPLAEHELTPEERLRISRLDW
jgi:hypothetical protein